MSTEKHLVLYDDGCSGLAPLTHLRASFDLRTGAFTTARRQMAATGLKPVLAVVPAELTELTAEQWNLPVNRMPEEEGSFLVLNGRWASPCGLLPEGPGEALTDPSGNLLAACLDRAGLEKWLRHPEGTDGLNAQVRPEVSLLSRPWHVLQQMPGNLEQDLAAASDVRTWQPGPGSFSSIVGQAPVFLEDGAIIHPHVVLDTTAGPIRIGRGAEVRAMSVIVGPSYIGDGSIVVNHAHLRGHTAIGPLCKVGGEVNASVFQARSNKGHAGYLGNSFVGEWVNLGAETCTSNLKNTYGGVRMQCDPFLPPEDTGLTHLGSILGDHVKTAIGTRLSTGTCVHTGSMLALSGFSPKCVGPLEFLTDSGAGIYRFEEFWKVVQRVMARRGEKPTPALRRRLELLVRR